MLFKLCTKCGKEQPLLNFRKRSDRKIGFSSRCKKCLIKDKEKSKKEIPWRFCLYAIQQRCNDSNHKYYKYYGGRGIKCLITERELKYLWNLCLAFEMKKPSIDRINKNENYTFDNCQFIEQRKNSSKDRKIKILQFDLNGNFIKEWAGAIDAQNSLNVDSSAIIKVCRNNLKTAGKFIWKYKKGE